MQPGARGIKKGHQLVQEYKMVPKKHAHEIDPTDLDDDSE